MASEVKPVLDPDRTPPETYGRSPATGANYAGASVVLRPLLFATSLVAVLLMVTSKETKRIPVPALLITITAPASFKHSPAFIYYVAALSVVGLYSILSTLASLTALSKTNTKSKILLRLAMLDVVMLGLMASAIGSAGSVAYLGFKGNSHVNWNKICNTFHKFCRYIAVSLGISLIGSVLLVILIMLSIHSLHCHLRH